VTLNELDAEDTDTRMRMPAIIRPRRSVENHDRPTGWRPLRIAMVGQKGMPATYGGIERHVEEMSSRLVALGHEVTVYCRDSYDAMPMDQYRGVRLKRTPTLATKHLDAIVHAGTATMAALKDRPDVLHYHGIGPALVAPAPPTGAAAACPTCASPSRGPSPRTIETGSGGRPSTCPTAWATCAG
jgi:glycosyltransferase involved in cell wall biosynthesis